jgi:ABC-type lipoprotein export system ATPase subunit
VSVAIQTYELFRIYEGSEGSAVALQGLTLSVHEGELVVVFGPSGSGKTTFLRILAGLDRPSAGTVDVLGADLRTIRGRDRTRYRSRVLGYADQHYTRALEPELPARELVALQLALQGEPAPSRLRRADELLERVGLADRRDARPRELSGGQQQRVALCAALAHEPRLFIADEPTGELDAASARTVYETIRDLTAAAGATTVIVSHDPESAAIADRVVHVRDGRVSAETARESGHAEQIVVARGGWIRLPEELLRTSRIDGRANAWVEDGRIVIARPSPAAAPVDEAEPPARRRQPSDAAVVAELRDVSKRYGAGERAREVLGGLDARFESSRVTVVTGPSGSGKTTLLHLLAGIEDPTEGDAVVLGAPVGPLDADARARLRREAVALVTQGADLIPFLSARENVELSLALRRLDAGEASERAAEALDGVGLAELADQRVARLSTGERQRVALARAIAARPRLLLADEPTARLDEANGRAVGALFRRLADESGVAVVCATHDPVLIEQSDAEVPLAGSS